MVVKFRVKSVRVRQNPRAKSQIENAPGTQTELRRQAVRINGIAKLIFISQVKHTHPVTLPAYSSSFKIRRAIRGTRVAYEAYNDDPAAFWVEFGAYLHHLTHDQILKYRPFGRAVDAAQLGDF